jgi:hypothetical protein
MALYVPPRPQLILPSGTADCYLQGESASVLRLVPWGGNQIMIAGVRYTIPAAGVVLAPNAGWASIPILYAVAYWTGSAVGLSVVDPAVNPLVFDAFGMASPQGRPDLTIVGAFTQNGTNGFYLAAQYAGCVSYWNRRQRKLTANLSANSVNRGMAEIATTLRLSALAFPDSHLHFDYTGTVYVDTATVSVVTQVYYNFNGGALNPVSPAANFATFIAYSTAQYGLHFDIGPAGQPANMTTYLYGYTNAGTATWSVDLNCHFEG